MECCGLQKRDSLSKRVNTAPGRAFKQRVGEKTGERRKEGDKEKKTMGRKTQRVKEIDKEQKYLKRERWEDRR
jgi:hypothetical protein